MRCGVKFTMTFLPGAVAPVRPCSISCNTPYRDKTAVSLQDEGRSRQDDVSNGEA